MQVTVAGDAPTANAQVYTTTRIFIEAWMCQLCNDMKHNSVCSKLTRKIGCSLLGCRCDTNRKAFSTPTDQTEA